ncbi:hypothetical protein [Streptomyces sp. NPDC006446]|uniref:hypothetical protein n=1 Tax=Streptomyces sp. NPDC006446 TaxID=3154301 RepID=UPI0033A4EA6C
MTIDSGGPGALSGLDDLGEPDRPATPTGSRIWDERSETWLVAEEADGRAAGAGAGAGEGAAVGTGTDLADLADLAGDSLATDGPGPDAGPERLRGAGRGVGPGSGAARGARPGPGAAADRADGSHGARRPAGRRGAADPVKALIHRHRELCERAVDPLEIAAGLEAHGVTDRTAARFRHRDVFSLAEEMFARVPRDGESTPRTETPGRPGTRAYWAALALVPGALGAAVVAGVRLTDGQPRLAVAAFGTLAMTLGLHAALRRGPLSTRHRTTSAARGWTCWLIVYALVGDGLLSAGLDGGPDGPWPLAVAPVLALALACAPAAWCAQLFVARARLRLNASRGLEEFASSVRPLLLGAFGLFLCALAGLLALCGTALNESPGYAGAGALGALLLLARLLTARGFTQAPAVALAAAGAAEATALATVFAARLPGCSFLAVPVDSLVGAGGPGAVPALACGAGALVLLVHATRALTRASAHALPCEAP